MSEEEKNIKASETLLDLVSYMYGGEYGKSSAIGTLFLQAVFNCISIMTMREIIISSMIVGFEASKRGLVVSDLFLAPTATDKETTVKSEDANENKNESHLDISSYLDKLEKEINGESTKTEE